MSESGATKNKINVTPFLFVLKSGLLLFAFYFVTRCVFYLLNLEYFSAQSNVSIVYAFLHGVRFDAASIALLNSPLMLSLFVLAWFKSWSRFVLSASVGYFLLVNGGSLTLNLIDSAYFPYTGKRSGLESLSMMRDVSMQMPQLIAGYWVLALITCSVLCLLVVAVLLMKKRLPKVEVSIGGYVLIVVIATVSLVFLARGGLQAKPIRSLTAYSWPNSDLGSLVLNTSFTFMREKASDIKRLDFYDSEKVAYDLLEKSPIKITSNVSEKSQNVVVIILESFGLEYFGPPYGQKNYTPFLTSLSQKGRFFPFGIANGRRSIEAIPSIFSGIPSLLPEAFMRSSYQSNKVYGLGELVKRHGYQTAFFHGAKNGSMYFDDTTYRLGFDEYYGENEHPNSDDFDGQWGIFDEPFLQFTAQTLDALQPPFLAGVFTISSHPPYSLPEKYQDVIPEGDIPMHRVVQYSDMALKKFFEVAANKEWFKDTLFVITADHTSDNYDKRFATPLGRHQIPIILYHPNGGVKPEVVHEIAQQVDIPATVIDYLNLPEGDRLMPFGRSLLQPTEYDEAIIKEEGAYWLLLHNQYVKLTFDGLPVYDMGILPPSFGLLESDGLKKENSQSNKKILRERINSYTQLYINGLIDNNHYPNLMKTTQ